jgi:uncharacterized protein (DUF1697 family)
MERYAAFLRGINLGGRRITNDELRQRFEQLGLADVACFRASGNVIFGAEESEESKLSERVEVGLGKSLGYEVPVFLRNKTEMRAITAHDPFDPKQMERSAGKLQIALLEEKPTARAGKEVLARATDEDLLALEGRELYWLPAGGTLDSELDLKAIESTLGTWTMRTKGTIDQIAAKHFGV